jgi:hypothetical protein
MAEINPDYIELDKEMSSRELDTSPIDLLEKIKQEGRVWEELSEEYGVDNPDPPWRINLESTCDNLANGYMSPFNICKPVDEREEPGDGKIDAVERRWEEDQLVNELYADVPFPERTLLALAHSMIRRGILSEEELAIQMKKVSDRLNMEDGAYEDEALSNTKLAQAENK